jgi:hypothetical protein
LVTLVGDFDREHLETVEVFRIRNESPVDLAILSIDGFLQNNLVNYIG